MKTKLMVEIYQCITSIKFQVSPDIWLLFQSIYGGGPEVMIRPNGSVHVSSNGGNAAAAAAANKLPALTARIRARSTSETVVQQQQAKPRPGICLLLTSL